VTSPAVKLMMASGGAGVSLPDAITALSPAGYWKLDETSGSTATDSSSNARDGTYTQIDLATYLGGDSVDYAGMGSPNNPMYVTISDNDDWSIGAGMTVFVLCYPDDFGGDGGSASIMLARLDNISGNQFEWAISAAIDAGSTSYLDVLKCNAGFTSYRIAQSSTKALTSGEWNAVVVRFTSDSVTAADDFWVNSSTELGQGTPTVVGTGTAAGTTARLSLGNRRDATNQRWDGGLAHVAIFNYELSDSEIGDLLIAAANEGWT